MGVMGLTLTENNFRIADNPPTILDQTVGIVPPSMM